MRHVRLNPLIDALPELAVLRLSDEATGPWLSSISSQLVDELENPSPGSSFVIERSLELFCAASVRD
jgi:hypothetical protein